MHMYKESQPAKNSRLGLFLHEKFSCATKVSKWLKVQKFHGAYGIRTLKFPSTLRIVLLVLGRRRLVPAPDVDLAHETKEYLESFPFRSPIVVFFMNENAVDKFMGDLGRHRCYIGMFLNKIRKLTNFII